MRGQLQQRTNLKAKFRYEIHLRSAFDLMKRHARLRINISDISEKQLNDFLFIPLAEHIADAQLKMLLRLNHAIIQLECNDCVFRRQGFLWIYVAVFLCIEDEIYYSCLYSLIFSTWRRSYQATRLKRKRAESGILKITKYLIALKVPSTSNSKHSSDSIIACPSKQLKVINATLLRLTWIPNFCFPD